MIELTPKQDIAYEYLYDNETRELIFGGGAGGGKSFFGCFWIIEMALKYPGTQYVIGRSQLSELKRSTLKSFFQVLEIQKIPPAAFSYNENKSECKFFNGSIVWFMDLFSYPSDPNFQALGSLEITAAFVDEVSEISERCWNILRSRIRFKLDHYKLKSRILGSCNPSKEWCFSNFYLPWENNSLPPSKKFVQSLAKDNPHVYSEYEETLKDLDDETRERLLEGNWHFESDNRSLVTHAQILKCFDSTAQFDPEKKIRMSVDLAMQGRDNFVIGLVQENLIRFELVKNKSTGKSIVEDINQIAKEYDVIQSDIIIDADGMGSFLEGGFLTSSKMFHAQHTAKDKQFLNLKTQCAFKLAEKINKEQLKITFSNVQLQQAFQSRVIKELGALKQKSVDADEKRKSIISKDEMRQRYLDKKSPDFLDVLIMAQHFSIMKGFTWLSLTV